MQCAVMQCAVAMRCCRAMNGRLMKCMQTDATRPTVTKTESVQCCTIMWRNVDLPWHEAIPSDAKLQPHLRGCCEVLECYTMSMSRAIMDAWWKNLAAHVTTKTWRAAVTWIFNINQYQLLHNGACCKGMQKHQSMLLCLKKTLWRDSGTWSNARPHKVRGAATQATATERKKLLQPRGKKQIHGHAYIYNIIIYIIIHIFMYVYLCMCMNMCIYINVNVYIQYIYTWIHLYIST